MVLTHAELVQRNEPYRIFRGPVYETHVELQIRESRYEAILQPGLYRDKRLCIFIKGLERSQQEEEQTLLIRIWNAPKNELIPILQKFTVTVPYDTYLVLKIQPTDGFPNILTYNTNTTQNITREFIILNNVLFDFRFCDLINL